MPARSNFPDADPTGDDSLVTLAVIAKPHGLSGEVTVELFTDFPERIAENDGLQLTTRAGSRPVRVLSVRGLFGSRGILKLEGIDDRDQAGLLRGGLIAVKRDAIPPLAEGEFYDFQIVGMRVLTEDGRDLGKVSEILRTGANDIYMTDRVPIPAVDRFISEISVERGEIIVRDIDELLE